MKTKLLVLAFLAVSGFTISTAHANEWNKKTYFRTDQSFLLPGAQLKAGFQAFAAGETYVFKLQNSLSNRATVLIYSGDETRYLGVVMAIPAWRSFVTDDPDFIFAKTAEGETYLKYWFLAGEESGVEFVGKIRIGEKADLNQGEDQGAGKKIDQDKDIDQDRDIDQGGGGGR